MVDTSNTSVVRTENTAEEESMFFPIDSEIARVRTQIWGHRWRAVVVNIIPAHHWAPQVKVAQGGGLRVAAVYGEDNHLEVERYAHEIPLDGLPHRLIQRVEGWHHGAG